MLGRTTGIKLLTVTINIMNNKITISIFVVAIIVVGGYFLLKNSGQSAKYQQTPAVQKTVQDSSTSEQPPVPTETNRQNPAPQTNNQTSEAPPATPKSFTVNGNDNSADLTIITVAKGTPVTITFGADADGTYHGGLDFRSSVVSTGTIAPGSTKTVTFTAQQSFVFTPYWPATNIAKPYKINITVE